eukprot:2121700-Rhodomonas_salina.6
MSAPELRRERGGRRPPPSVWSSRARPSSLPPALPARACAPAPSPLTPALCNHHGTSRPRSFARPHARSPLQRLTAKGQRNSSRRSRNQHPEMCVSRPALKVGQDLQFGDALGQLLPLALGLAHHLSHPLDLRLLVVLLRLPHSLPPSSPLAPNPLSLVTTTFTTPHAPSPLSLRSTARTADNAIVEFPAARDHLLNPHGLAPPPARTLSTRSVPGTRHAIENR